MDDGEGVSGPACGEGGFDFDISDTFALVGAVLMLGAVLEAVDMLAAADAAPLVNGGGRGGWPGMVDGVFETGRMFCAFFARSAYESGGGTAVVFEFTFVLIFELPVLILACLRTELPVG